MNANRLKSLLRRLLQDEEVLAVQEKLSTTQIAFSKMVSEPGQPVRQTALADSLKELEESVTKLAGLYSPSFRRQLDELGLLPYYSEVMINDIRRSISENPLTPAVAMETVKDWKARRAQVIEDIGHTYRGLERLNIEDSRLGPGDAEIGFKIPRTIFDNNLEGLVAELRDIRRIIRAFSETATGSAENIEVREINSSDPTFFFGLSTLTIAVIGGAVTWALATWKNLEEIRKIRAETKKIKGFATQEIDRIFDDRIKAIIEEAVEEHVESLLSGTGESPGRVHEQRTDLTWANKALFAHIERGMTVEIRFIAPPQDGSVSSTGGPDGRAIGHPERDEQTVYDLLGSIAEDLEFPEPDDSPVLALPPRYDADETPSPEG